MCKPLIHKVDLEELGDAVEPIRDSIRKLFEDAYISILDASPKDVNTFHDKIAKEQNE